MPFCFYSLVLFAVAVVDQGIFFTNPAENTSQTPSQNQIFAEGSVLHVAWAYTQGSSSAAATSLVLFPLNGTWLLYPPEYLIQNVLDATSLDWTVFTTKDLAISDSFVFAILYEGQTNPATFSGPFNISTAVAMASSTSSLASSTASAVTVNPSTETTIATAGSASASASSTPSDNASGGTGLSTGAKAGVGLGIAAAMLIVIVQLMYKGWRSKDNARALAIAAAQTRSQAMQNYVNNATRYEMSGGSAGLLGPYELDGPECQELPG